MAALMAPGFGTSGLRGLAEDLTDTLVAAYTRAFLAACPAGRGVFVGRDLRASSPRIARAVLQTVRAAGLPAADCGVLPTPALALAAMAAGAAAIMVTGSHIPADRNGLKFYTPRGEIGKPDEAAILAALGRPAGPAPAPGARIDGGDAAQDYAARYRAAFGGQALGGLRIGVWQHSSVARDLLVDILKGLGAGTVPLGRSGRFVPVDTEALDPHLPAQLRRWCAQHRLDAVVSTDGDGDRPLLADAGGHVIPGDVLGVLTARTIGAEVIATPVSSNTMVAQMPFRRVLWTRIGSPFVIAAMQAALDEDPAARVAGYEANGGFLLGFAAQGPAGPIAPLMTRDSLLPIVAPLAAAQAAGQGVAALVAGLPARFTARGRLQGIAPERARAFLAALAADPGARADFFAATGPELQIDRTDGLLVSFGGGTRVHLRPSGNAPEFRCHAEAGDPGTAQALLRDHLARLAARLE